MAAPYEPPIRPSGAAPWAADLNAVGAAVYQAGLIGGAAFGDVGVAQGLGGVQLLDGAEKSHWAKIGARGTGATYAHTPVRPNGDGTFTDIPDNPTTFWGTAADRPAREVNGSEDVPEGAYARLYPDPTNGWLFQFAGAGIASDSPISNCLADFVGWLPDDCVRITVLAGADPGACSNVGYQVLDATSPGGYVWVTDETFPVPGGDATVEIYEQANGQPGATIHVWTGSAFESIEGLYVGCSASSLEFSFRSHPLLCDDTGVPCGDNTLRVRAACITCPTDTCDPTCDCAECPDGAPGSYTFTIAGGTGDFATANGTWAVCLDAETCEWTSPRSRNGWRAVYTRVGTRGTLTLEYGRLGAGLYLEYFVNPVDTDCFAANTLALIDSGGTGTAPGSPTLTAAGATITCPTVDVACCSPVLLPETLTVTFGGTLSSFGSVPLTYDAGATPVGWVGTVAVGCDNTEVTIQFYCTAPPPPAGGNWLITGQETGGSVFGDVVTVTCSGPFLGSAGGTIPPGGIPPNCSAGAYTITLTE